MNPNGIIFGKDASVNTEGAFFLSTADYLEFVDGTNLPVNDLQNNLLSISDPAAFGFIQSDTPGNIEFDQCNLTSFSGDVSIIGNNILMNKTILITRNSEINIVALDYPGKVNLCQKTIDDKEMNSGKIQVTGNSLIKSVLSLYPKSIWIKGEKMISDNSVVHLENEGSEYPGKIMIDVEELIIQNDSEIMSTSNKPEASISKDSGDIIIKSSNFFLTNSDIIVKSETNGNNGDINININNLTIKDDCYIENSTEGIGVIGEIKIHADDKVSINSSYFASMTGYGCDNCTSGDITIDAFDILLDNSIFIFNSGINGDVIFKAINAMSINNSNISTVSLFDTYHNYDQKPGNIRLYGKNISFFQSRINSGTSSINNAGSIDIETNFLDIDSSMIRSMSFGEQA